MTLRLRTFGGLSIEGGAIPESGSGRRPLALLALLAVAGTRGMSRDKVVAYLWPESDAERARNSLNQALSTLRRDLSAEEIVLGKDPIRLNGDVIESDVQEFANLLESGDPERAVGVHAGPFLDGVFIKGALEFERWVEDERRRFHHLQLEALESLAADAERRGDNASAIRWWRKRASAEPHSSSAALGLMQALSAAGDSPGALHHFREHEILLRAELGATPDPRILAFAQTLTAPRQLTAPAASPPDAPPSPRPAADGLGAPNATADARLVTPAARPILSPRTLMFAGTVIVIGIVGGTLLAARRDDPMVVAGITKVTQPIDSLHLDAAISPDGKLIAYSAGTLGRMRIVVQPARGGPARTITDSTNVPPTPGLGGDHRWPRWSPDGLTIAFEAGRDIRAVSVLGGPTRVLVDSGGKPTWSPDGRRLVYTFPWGQELRIFNLDSATSRSVVETGVSGGTAVWSPDGGRIAFMRGGSALYVGGSLARVVGEKAQFSLWIVDADGRNPIAITPEDHLNASPVWGPDGRSIFFVSDRDGLRDVYRQRLEDDGRPRGAPERLTTGANVHTFTLSRDGDQIAYSMLEKHAQIWMAPISSGETPFTAARQLTRDRESIEYIALSPDGRWLSYDSDRDGAFRHIYKRAFDGTAGVGEPVRVTADSADDFAPRWSPDGHEIAFHRIVRGVRDVFVTRADGRKTDRVTSDSAQDYNPDWAPDGRSIVYRARLDSAHTQEIFVTTRDATGRWSTPQPVVVRGGGGVGQSVVWSPSGEEFAGGGGTVPVNGGERRRFVERVKLDGGARFVAWGPSSQELYFLTRDAVNAASFWRVELTRNGGPAFPQRLLRLSDPTKGANHNSFDTDGRNLFFTIAADRAAVFVARIDRR